MDSRVAGFLSRLFPGFEERLITESSFDGLPVISLDLPPASRADYQFRFYFEPEMQIHARLLGMGREHYFWYMVFEEAAFGGDLEKLCIAFVGAVENVIFHPTRIIQKRGLLSHSFKLEYQRDEQWQGVDRISCSRWFKVPPIRGQRHVYFSPPVVRSENAIGTP